MSPHRRLAAALIGSALLLTSTGCQASSPQTQGSTVKPRNTQMPSLPEDPNAAEAAVRAMLMKEAIVLLKASGWAQGGVSHGVNVHKGPLYLQWGKGYSGCHFAMTTVNIRQYLPGISDVTRVPELAPFKAGMS